MNLLAYPAVAVCLWGCILLALGRSVFVSDTRNGGIKLAAMDGCFEVRLTHSSLVGLESCDSSAELKRHRAWPQAHGFAVAHVVAFL